MKILDIGCGRGELTREILNNTQNCKLVACDINARSLSEFKKSIKGQSASFYQCNAENLPFKSKTFDVVLMIDVLEHLKKPAKAFSEAKRVLKTGGVYYLIVPCEADLFTLDGWIKRILKVNLKEKPIGHIQQFTYQEIRQMFIESGFKIKTINFSYFFLYQLLSLIYFCYANLIKKGDYVQLVSPNKKTSGFSLIEKSVYLGTFFTNLESYFYRILPMIRGQEMHITAVKI